MKNANTSFVEVDSAWLAQMSTAVITYIDQQRARNADELFQELKERQAEYKRMSWFKKLFIAEPPEHPKHDYWTNHVPLAEYTNWYLNVVGYAEVTRMLAVNTLKATKHGQCYLSFHDLGVLTTWYNTSLRNQS